MCMALAIKGGNVWVRSDLFARPLNEESDKSCFFSFVSSQWYTVNLGGIEPEAGKLFLQLDSTDPETQVFLERCQERSDAVFTQLFHLVARTLLAPFVSQTSING